MRCGRHLSSVHHAVLPAAQTRVLEDPSQLSPRISVLLWQWRSAAAGLPDRENTRAHAHDAARRAPAQRALLLASAEALPKALSKRLSKGEARSKALRSWCLSRSEAAAAILQGAQTARSIAAMVRLEIEDLQMRVSRMITAALAPLQVALGIDGLLAVSCFGRRFAARLREQHTRVSVHNARRWLEEVGCAAALNHLPAWELRGHSA